MPFVLKRILVDGGLAEPAALYMLFFLSRRVFKSPEWGFR